MYNYTHTYLCVCIHTFVIYLLFARTLEVQVGPNNQAAHCHASWSNYASADSGPWKPCILNYCDGLDKSVKGSSRIALSTPKDWELSTKNYHARSTLH